MAESTTRGFVHLHTHTEYSPLDGMGRMSDLVKAAAADGNPAFADTDHGTLAGAWKLRKFCKAAGIKAIPGCEVYMAIGSRFKPETILVDADDESGDAIDDEKGTKGALGETRKKKKIYEHLTLLAYTPEGWRNLVRLHNSAQATYSPGGGGLAKPQPLMDFDLLEKYREGIIVLTGCLGGGVAGALVRAHKDPTHAGEHRAAARSYLTNLVRIFGDENVFVEVMDHGIPDQHLITEDLRAIAGEFGLRMVATNDSHYTHERHSKAHEAWLAVGTKKVLSSEKRFKFHGHGHHLRTEAEMRALFGGEAWWQAACDATVEIADRVHPDIFGETRLRLPVYPVAQLNPEFRPQNVDHDDTRAMSNAYFRFLVSKGAREREGLAPDERLSAEVNKRIAWEYNVIVTMGLADYFLIVRDVIEWCRSTRGLPTKAYPKGREGQKKPIRVGPGRGSAAGSYCSYALGIVLPHPIKNGLLFERFLDLLRVGMPDVDVDFEQGRRPEVIAYLVAMWGSDRVAQIGTFGMARTKAAINDAARVLEKQALGDKLSKLVPIEGGKPASIASLTDDAFLPGRDFRALVAKSGEDATAILELASAFEDVIKTPGIHASGVLIADEPMFDLVPLRRSARGKGAALNAPMITEWDGVDCDDYGLLKLDVLGLRNLDVVQFTVDSIKATTGEDVEPADIDPDCGDERAQAAWALLRAGRTAGVFQMESEGMTKLAMDSGPTCLDDLSTIVALYRPGPLGQGMDKHWAARKRGTEPLDYGIFTDDRDEQAAIAAVLDESLGVPVFQEQSMRLGDVVAGFGPNTRNRLRKAISKKKKDEIAAVGELWMENASKGVSNETGEPKVAFRPSSAQNLWDAIKSAGEYQFNKCLAGETVVTTGRHTDHEVAALYRRLHASDRRADGICPACLQRPSRIKTVLCDPCRQWRAMFNGRGFHVLSYDFADGRIRPKRVKDVHFNGRREVYRITLADGRTIRATGNHRFLVQGGWVRVEHLSLGDELMTSEGYEAQQWDGSYRLTTGERQGAPGRLYAPGSENVGYVDGGHVALAEWTEATRQGSACAACGVSGVRLERAHLDGDRTHNAPGNLAWLCVSHHKEHDYEVNGRRRKWEKGYATGTSAIVSIEADGVTDTYDLEMDDEGHNFIANGIVSHNSHTTAYGLLAYWTAWLKANWPAEFAAAILAATESADKRAKAILSIQQEGIELLAPDINVSGAATQPEGASAVRLGLSEVRGVGANAAVIVAEREANGPFTGLADLLLRVHAAPKAAADTEADQEQEQEDEAEVDQATAEVGAILPVNVVESLVAAGALDSFGPRRGQMMISRAIREHPDLAVPDVDWGLLERSGRQRIAIGVITGQHPLSQLGAQLRSYTTPNGRYARPVSTVHAAAEREQVLLLGVLAGYSEKAYSKGRMAKITLEGTRGAIDGVMWDDDRQRVAFEPAVGQVVAISGTVRVREIEVEDEAGEVEIVSRRELTFRDMWLVPVEDPVVNRFALETDELAIAPERIEEAPVAVLSLPSAGPLEVYAPRLPEAVVATLGRALYDCPWTGTDVAGGVWLFGRGPDAVIVTVGKVTVHALENARDLARANSTDGWVQAA
ncbi:DNA polymerase III subunit alpha [Cellulomonas hominis]|uniref:DNA polymerase III subunit alpha n=1 Tax=Cellulomonas hominis TaxID=156981 RepID=A0A7W8WBL7_9CELL|nr:DNA polymerase III subunit alpha [Cellulomonas hominis]MBB5474859.1 DNA-directed DNA polymerase III PolC [Cellulomonas hominis]NKY05935.1 DNA polymerase III subunit alpha [Cellulomonas hominis]